MALSYRLAIAALGLVLLAAPARPAETGAARWVSFRVRTVATTGGERAAVSSATVRGPAGTDLSLELREARFEMTASLRTDLVGGRVRIAARLTARRAAGTSERGLPLYEEDRLRETVEVAADGSEAMALLPFGPNPGGDELSVEVVPTLDAAPHAEGEPLDVRIDDPGPGGWIRVEASRVPHEFEVSAEVVGAGGGGGRFSLEEPKTIDVGGRKLTLTVDRVLRGCPKDQVGVTFDVDDVARGWSGIASGGDPLEYRLPSGEVLRLRVEPK